MGGAGISTVLVANRGEIAIRVMRTASRLGYRTVAVHSDVDAAAPHVAAADMAVAIGPAEATRSYLDQERILDAARSSGATAIHPGYGFLSENADFAAACAAAGITFIGPSPEAIRAMGDKAEAKRRVEGAGVPTLPGYNDADQSDESLIAAAGKIGFPLMVKAAAGGGGKGMRLVAEVAVLPEALAAARREAEGAFGSEILILERAVISPRHVEIQVMADTQGNTIHLGERDCSTQRRHQKVVEEAPAPGIDPELRERTGAAAIAAAEAVGYVGAGTVEFLFEERGGESSFYFLEMNTRLQVEHPVTEMVTGLDLVELQLRVAAGEELGITQEDVAISGHAIEARLYAEDPAQGFMPQSGDVLAWSPPGGPGVRVDSGVESGSAVTVHYDPMIAKLIAHGPDRETARVRLTRALEETTVLGPTTNRAFLISVLEDERFSSAAVSTAMLEQLPEMAEASRADLAAVAIHLYEQGREAAAGRSPALAGWASSGELGSWFELDLDGEAHSIRVSETDAGAVAAVDGELFDAEAPPEGVVVAAAHGPGGRVLAHLRRLDLDLRDLGAVPPLAADAAGEGVLTAPMHGSVIAVEVAIGEAVEAGQKLIVMEAMKMEQEIVADVDGTVEEIVEAGGQVEADQVLVRIAAEAESSADGAPA